MRKTALRGLWATCVCVALLNPTTAAAATPDVVLYAIDAATVRGNWSMIADPTAASGAFMGSPDAGWSDTTSASATPSNYVDLTFTAPANTPYHVWLRLRATANSKFNDSLYVQFSDARATSGAALYGIGTSSALTINLATNASGSSLVGWGWQDGAYWLGQVSTVTFASSSTHTIRIQAREDGVQFDQIVLSPATYLSTAPGPVKKDTTIVSKPVLASTPFLSTAAAIPGTIEVENFDNGGEGLAYHDDSPGNSGGLYRATDVDIAANADNSGNVVGWVSAGEWLKYSVNVASAGTYTVGVKVASYGRGGTFHIEASGTNVTGSMAVPDTGGWQNWQTVTAQAVLSAGPQSIRLVMDTSGAYAVGNFDAMTFTFVPVTSTPFLGAPLAIPGTIELENFDNGGEGIAYHDDSAGNTGGEYRQTGVDIAQNSAGGYVIGWVSAGEWLKYTVNVATAGNYTASIRVASSGPGGTFHLESNGTNLTGPVTVPDTGDWQNWTIVSAPVTLTAGVQVLRLAMDSAGLYAVGNFDSLQLAVVTTTTTPPPSTPPPTTPPPSGSVPTSYSSISDRVVRPKPALPTLGPAGYKFSDPTFGSPMLRVTDPSTRPGSVGVSYRSPSEPPTRAWNSSTTRFYVTATDGTIVPYAFDAATMTASRIAGSQDGGLILAFASEPEFSALSPDLAFGFSSQYDHAVVTKYNFATNTYSVEADVRDIVPNVDANGRTYLRGVETGVTNNVEYMTFIFGGTSQDQDRYAIWFPVGNLAARKLVDTVASTINGAPTNIPLGFHAHAVGIDLSGRFVVIGATAPDIAAGKAPNYVWDTLTDTFSTIPMNANGGGHGAMGFGVNINNPDDIDSMDFIFRDLQALAATRFVISPMPTPSDFSVSSHASWANAQPTQLVPVLAAMFRYGNNTNPWREWDEEVIAIRTDGVESRVWRFAHHRSNYNNNTTSDTNPFWYTPRPNISPDGRWAIFTSNWEKTLGNDTRETNKRQDVFLVKLQ